MLRKFIKTLQDCEIPEPFDALLPFLGSLIFVVVLAGGMWLLAGGSLC